MRRMAHPASLGDVDALATGLSRKFKSGRCDYVAGVALCRYSFCCPPREFPVDRGDDQAV